MAIQTKIVNGSFTEIYAGGGNFITLPAPTNFHQFWTQKVLTPGESIEDFKEVTASEKAAIEAADAKWVRPPQSFIDQCKTADPSVVWNEGTGFFELNGLRDISYAEMIDIWRFTSGPLPQPNSAYATCQFRTNLCPVFSNYTIDIRWMFQANKALEVAVLPQYYSDGVLTSKIRDTWSLCTKLREIKNIIKAPQIQTLYDGFYRTFSCCYSLETVWLKQVYDSVDFQYSPKLRLECVKYLIENANNPKAMTLTLHPTAYARVTDELFALAAEKNITIAST